VGLTELGTAAIGELGAVSQQIVDERWGPHAHLVDALQPLVARVLDAAMDTAGPTLGVMAPVW
jgi:hypothetical protein